MSDFSDQQDKEVPADGDLLAIRALLNETGGVASVPKPKVRDENQPVRTAVPASQPAPAVVVAEVRTTAKIAAENPPAQPKQSRIALHARRLLGEAWAAMYAYRPDRKNILWTSLVLMLLLQPFFVLGWSLFFLGSVLLCFYVMGGDRFWRRVISMYQALQYRQPKLARAIKVRSYVLAKRWDSLLRHLPDGLATALRSPDLRNVIAADARHEAAVVDRLARLRESPSAG